MEIKFDPNNNNERYLKLNKIVTGI